MQKTAYEMRISDRSSDVCSSDLRAVAIGSRKAATDVDATGLHAGLGDYLAEQIKGGDVGFRAAALGADVKGEADGTALPARFLHQRRRIVRRGAELGRHVVESVVGRRRDRKSTRLNSRH